MVQANNLIDRYTIYFIGVIVLLILVYVFFFKDDELEKMEKRLSAAKLEQDLIRARATNKQLQDDLKNGKVKVDKPLLDKASYIKNSDVFRVSKTIKVSNISKINKDAYLLYKEINAILTPNFSTIGAIVKKYTNVQYKGQGLALLSQNYTKFGRSLNTDLGQYLLERLILIYPNANTQRSAAIDSIYQSVLIVENYRKNAK